jgi:L-ascorbate metabolism protein UlaG (beta-lactamase superfamily)
VADLLHQRVVELARRNAQHDTLRYRSLLLHWFARWFRRPTAAELGLLPPVDPGQVAVTWGGHATALVRYHRLSLLCDPVLARSLGAVRRETAPGLTLEALADVDLVLITYAAPDHLDLATLARLSRSATVVVPPRAGAMVSPLGFARLIELSVGSSITHRGLEVIAEPVKHGERDSPAQSYILRGDGPTVYFCGASGYFPGFAEIGRRHWPDLALLPIGGYSPRSFRQRFMSPLDALYAFEDLRARVMVPIRHSTFALSYERMGDPGRWLAELVAERHLERFVVPLAAGESRVFVPPAAHDARAEEEPTVATRGPAHPGPGWTAPPARAISEPDAMTIPGGPAVVGPAAGSPGRLRRAPALIVPEHEDETAVFDRPVETRVEAADDEEEDDDERTRAMTPLPSDPDAEPVAAPVPGSR